MVGQEQLAFAKLATQADNKANGTKITLVQGDTQLMPARAATVTQQFISSSKVLGVIGPASSPEAEAVGPLFDRAGMTFITGSATDPTLTLSGKNRTLFRVVSRGDLQGPQDANFIVKHLSPKSVMIVDDQEDYSTGLVSAMLPVFQRAGIKVDHESVNQKVSDFSSLVAKVMPQTSVVVLPWHAANGEKFAKNLAEQKKSAVIVGTDRMYSPRRFTTPGSYVSSIAPDITAVPGDTSIVATARTTVPKFGTFAPPAYAATHVLDEAIAAACKSGTPLRSSVLAAVKATSEPTSILGQPIRFDTHGDLIGAKWFLFKINAQGKYTLVPNS